MLRNDSRLAIACAAAAGLVAPTLASGNEPQVLVLNEIRIDQPGADDDEYFELIGGPPGAALDRVTYLVLGDDSQLGSGVIEAVIPMTAQFLGLDGSGSLQRNDNSLVAISVPSAFGIFVQADMTGAPIVSAIGGNLCLRGAIRRLDSVVFPAGNVARLELDFADPASVESSTMAGVTLHYQFAHRDTIFAGGGNWTSGLSVTWAP